MAVSRIDVVSDGYLGTSSVMALTRAKRPGEKKQADSYSH